MHHLEVKRRLDGDEIGAVQLLLDTATHHDGHHALGEHQWLDLVHGGRAGFAGIVATLPGHAHPIGYAQVSRSGGTADNWSLELVIAPHHREDETIASGLVEAALGLVQSEGGGRVHLWVSKPQPWHDRVARAHGLRRARDLYQLRRPLPTGIASDLDWRPFEPGRDEEAWLEVNNAAFADHTEQGQWSRQVLEEREALDWFDPSGFLLHEGEGGRLDGFCWTKVHADHDPPLGEIYVIAVAPWAQGKGLGRRLVLAGLDVLARRGIGTAMLYVDAANTAAVKLYVDLGFTLDHIDRAYHVDVTPGAAGPAAAPPLRPDG